MGNGIYSDSSSDFLTEDKGSHPIIMTPVELSQLSKLENVTDLTVSLPGNDFYWARNYASIETFTPDVMGFHWFSNAFYYLKRATGPDRITVYGQNREDVEFVDPDSDGVFRPRGLVSQEIREDKLLSNYLPGTTGTVKVWQLTEPGKWEIDFYDKNNSSGTNIPADVHGMMLQYRDAHGNTRTYKYTTLTNSGEVRLSKIYLNGTDEPNAMSNASDAVINLTWFDLVGSPAPNYDAQLNRVDVVRSDGNGGTIVTQWVDYDYDEELRDLSLSISDDVGDSGLLSSSDPALLVQVKKGQLVDEVPASLSASTAADGNYYVRFTQYRYHDNRTPSGFDTDSDGLPLNPEHASGYVGALKSVISPDQIEFLAQKLNDNATGSEAQGWLGYVGEATYRAAESLLAQDDDDDTYSNGVSTKAVTDVTPIALASKVVSYWAYGDQVSTQWLQANCGCAGGGGAGFKRATFDILYEHATILTGPGLPVGDPDDYYKVVVMKEYEGNSSSVSREYRYELVYPRGTNGAPYLVSKALYDHAGSQGWWVWWYDHNFETDGFSLDYDYGRPGDTVDIYSPSAMSSYTPATSSSATAYTSKSSGGLVHRHTYNTDRRHTESLTGTFDSGSPAFTPYEKITYMTATSSTARTYLPEKIEWNRTGASWGTAAADEIETTTYGYKFADSVSLALLRMQISVEAEIVAENGPGVQTYDSTVMYDARGQMVWIVDAGGSMTYRGYDATTGALTTLIQNADPAGSGSSNPAFVPGDYGYGSLPGGWGTNGSGGDLESTIAVDLLGRWTTKTAPGGVVTNLRREVVADSERVGVAYMSALILPHKLAGTSPVEFNGPAARSWLNAAGNPIRSSEFAIDGTQTYTPASGTYTLSTELSRVTTIHDIHGQDVATRRYHDVAGTNFSGTSAYNEWTTAYDAFGRIESVQDPEGTISLFEYDALDRPIASKVSSTEPGATVVTVSEAYYDSSTTSQGIGNGNLGVVVLHTQEPGSGGLSGATRTIKRTHDFRNRLIAVENPEAPHYAYAYDNLDRVTGSATFSVATSSVSTSANRGWLTYHSYSQRGNNYRTSIATDASSSTPEFLQSDVWYDGKGRVIKSRPHSSPAMKYVYDGLDRVTTEYLTDARGDAKPGNSGNHASADDVTGDTVFEQTSYTYSDGDSLLDLVEHRVRSHDATAYGAIAPGDGVTSWMGYYYDDGDRMVASVDFGTNQSVFQTGGTAPTWPPGSAPSSTIGTYGTDEYIVSTKAFNARGLVDRTTDPMGDVTKYLYDDAERVIAVIEAYDDASLDSLGQYASGRWQFVDLDDDEDRVTSYVYNGVDQVVRMAAHLPDGSGDDAQVTEYTYGVTAASSPSTTDSLVYDKRLLRKVAYPDESTGDVGSGGSYEVSYSYNALGELRSVTDQNTTRHAYERDSRGRVTADRVENFGTGIDNAVKRIEIDYDGLGRMDTVESLDHATSGMGSVVNGVTYEYTPLWQVSKKHQDLDGVASINGTGGTETVEYVYATEEFDSSAISVAAHNYTRLDDLVYPSDSTTYPTVTVRYGNSTSADNHASRSVGFDFDGTAAVLYEHVGWGRIAEVDYAAPDIQLDRTFSHEGKRNTQGYSSQAAGVYPGWDRFGRVRLQAWVDGDLDTIRVGQSPDPNANVPGIPPIIEELQAYDRASNRTRKIDARPGAKRPNRDYNMAYDGLDRLASGKRGSWDNAYNPTTWTPTGTAVGNSEAWTYDALGNWNELLTDGNFDNDFVDTSGGAGYVDLAETRNHNMANELEEIDENQSVGGVDLSYLYDDAGNRTKKTYVSGVGYDTYIYDAWNRLVKITRTDEADPPITTDVSAYTYSGQHFRITEASGDQTREMYYSTSWQLLEEHIDEPGEDPDRVVQHFWGKRYIDDAVMHRTREASEETWAAADSFYHLTDPMYSTLAIVDGNGSLKERVYYSSYGVPTATRRADIDGDGDVDTVDLAYLAVSDIADVGTNTNYTVEFDIDRDGDVDSTDYGVWGAEQSMDPLGPGVLSDATTVDNRTGYDGYRWEPETQLWHVRFRAYDPYVGRWLQRDPLVYINGSLLYQNVKSNPTRHVDPLGLFIPPGIIKIINDIPPHLLDPVNISPNIIDTRNDPPVVVTPDDWNRGRSKHLGRETVSSPTEIAEWLLRYYLKNGGYPSHFVVSCHGAQNPGPFIIKDGKKVPFLDKPEGGAREVIEECEVMIIWACNLENDPDSDDNGIKDIRKQFPGIKIVTPVDGGFCYFFDRPCGNNEEKRTIDSIK